MKARCLNKNNPDYEEYGGRGITICQDWLVFDNFIRDMGDKPSKELMLERKNNDLGYSIDNCYWATPSQQQRNRRKFKHRRKTNADLL